MKKPLPYEKVILDYLELLESKNRLLVWELELLKKELKARKT